MAVAFEVLEKSRKIPPGIYGLFVISIICCASASPENSRGGPIPGITTRTQGKRHGQHAGRVAGHELLAEEFFGLFKLLHGLQQVGQAVDANHGCRVLVPQLEAACGPSLKAKRNHRLFLKLRAAKKSGSSAINSAAGNSPNRTHGSFTLNFLLYGFSFIFLPEKRDTLLASNRGLC